MNTIHNFFFLVKYMSWIKLVAIVLHCLYWELLEFTFKKKKNQTRLICTLFSNSNILLFLYLILTPKKNKNKIKQNKTKEGWIYLTHMVKSYIQKLVKRIKDSKVLVLIIPPPLFSINVFLFFELITILSNCIACSRFCDGQS